MQRLSRILPVVNAYTRFLQTVQKSAWLPERDYLTTRSAKEPLPHPLPGPDFACPPPDSSKVLASGRRE